MGVILTAHHRPAVLLEKTDVEKVVVKVLQGRQGDDRVHVGPTPPENPQDGWIWVDTSVG